jgi:hypothetical protein
MHDVTEAKAVDLATRVERIVDPRHCVPPGESFGKAGGADL